MNQTRKTVLSALLSSVAIVLQAVGSIITSLDLSAAALSGMIGLLIRYELGLLYSILSYFTVSILSILLLPNKLVGIFYICFFGLYPIFKSDIDKLEVKLSWIVKIVVFNILFSVLLYIGIIIIKIDDPLFTFTFLPYLLGNAAFILYDIAITRLYKYYIMKYRNRIFRNYHNK